MDLKIFLIPALLLLVACAQQIPCTKEGNQCGSTQVCDLRTEQCVNQGSCDTAQFAVSCNDFVSISMGEACTCITK